MAKKTLQERLAYMVKDLRETAESVDFGDMSKPVIAWLHDTATALEEIAADIQRAEDTGYPVSEPGERRVAYYLGRRVMGEIVGRVSFRGRWVRVQVLKDRPSTSRSKGAVAGIYEIPRVRVFMIAPVRKDEEGPALPATTPAEGGGE